MHDGIAPRLTLGANHDADTTFHRFAVNNKSDYLAHFRHLALSKYQHPCRILRPAYVYYEEEPGRRFGGQAAH